ncbi:MAG: fumarylacetoacetate hydrolase family protein [Actinomycetota bacterium]
MVTVRIRTARGEIRTGEVVDGAVRVGDEELDLAAIEFLPPCEPTKLIFVGLNYRDHAEEIGLPLPTEPLLFFKPPSAVTGHRRPVVRPPECTQLDYEAELALVIGKRAKRVRPDDALSFVAGYTVSNDITARNFQLPDSQWTRAKGYDTFAPLGPGIVPDLDPSSLAIECRVNGEIRQQSNTKLMAFGVSELVSFASSIMTLEPGDVISTGTPPGVGSLEPGDKVEVTVEGIGTLENEVLDEETL